MIAFQPGGNANWNSSKEIKSNCMRDIRARRGCVAATDLFSNDTMVQEISVVLLHASAETGRRQTCYAGAARACLIDSVNQFAEDTFFGSSISTS
jgi:hypothetical protein